MPATLASFSRASGRSVNLPVSNRTSDIFTIRPRAVSRVCRIALNCFSSWTRSSAFSVSNCAFCLAALSSSAWLAARCASFSRFRRSASAAAAATRASPSSFRRSASFLAAVTRGFVLHLQAFRFGCARLPGARRYLAFRRSASAALAASRASFSAFTRSACSRAAAACASFSRVRRSASALRLYARRFRVAAHAIRLGLRRYACALRRVLRAPPTAAVPRPGHLRPGV